MRVLVATFEKSLANFAPLFRGRPSEKDHFRGSFDSIIFYFSGTAGDSLDYHRAQAFTTKDRDNDKWSDNCALSYKGGWWYNSCHYSNLNGLYLNGQNSAEGMDWRTWKGSHYSVKRSEMKIRPRDF